MLLGQGGPVMRMRSILLTSVILANVACSGPESETPVDPQPGRYDMAISMTGEGFPATNQQKSLCLLPEQAKAFSSDPTALKDAIPYQPGCETKVAERKGNAFTVVRECSIGPDVKLAMNFNGTIRTDGFDMDGTMEATGAVNRSGKFSFSAKRTGDC